MAEKDITSAASEFFVVSALLRIGADATLTLGNKKKVDITVNKDGNSLMIDVKALRNGTNFPLNSNNKETADDNHYFIFVDYKDEFEKWQCLPELYVVSAKNALSVAADYKSAKQENEVRAKLKELSEDLSIFAEKGGK